MKIENSVKPKKIGIINKLGTSKSIKLIARTVYTKKPTERDFPSVELSQGIPEKPIIKEKKLKLKSISKFIVNRNLVAFMNDRKFSYQPKNSDTRDLLLYANLNSLIEKSKSGTKQLKSLFNDIFGSDNVYEEIMDVTVDDTDIISERERLFKSRTETSRGSEVFMPSTLNKKRTFTSKKSAYKIQGINKKSSKLKPIKKSEFNLFKVGEFDIENVSNKNIKYEDLVSIKGKKSLLKIKEPIKSKNQMEIDILKCQPEENSEKSCNIGVNKDVEKENIQSIHTLCLNNDKIKNVNSADKLKLYKLANKRLYEKFKPLEQMNSMRNYVIPSNLPQLLVFNNSLVSNLRYLGPKHWHMNPKDVLSIVNHNYICKDDETLQAYCFDNPSYKALTGTRKSEITNIVSKDRAKSYSDDNFFKKSSNKKDFRAQLKRSTSNYNLYKNNFKDYNNNIKIMDNYYSTINQLDQFTETESEDDFIDYIKDYDSEITKRRLSVADIEFMQKSTISKVNSISNLKSSVCNEINQQCLMVIEKEIESMTESIEKFKIFGSNFVVNVLECRKAALYIRTGKFSLALDILNIVILREPNLANAYWHRSYIWKKFNLPDYLSNDLRMVSKLNRNHVGCLLATSDYFNQLDENDLVIENLSRAIKLNPNIPKAYILRAEMYNKTGNPLLALNDYSNVRSLGPETIEPLIARSKHYLNSENWTSLLEESQVLINSKEFNTDARYMRGLANSHLKNYNAAIEDLSIYIHLNPNDYRAYYVRGKLLRKINVLQSIQDFSLSILLNGYDDSLDALFQRSLCYEQIGKYDDALYDIDLVCQLDGQNFDCYLNKGIILMNHKKHYYRAIEAFNTILQNDPTCLKALQCRIHVYMKISKYKEALLDQSRMVRLNAFSSENLIRMGFLLLQMKDYKKAFNCVKIAADINILNDNMPSIEKCQTAIVLTFLKKHEAAINILKNYSNRYPTSESIALLAYAYKKSKNYRKAIEVYNTSLDIMKQNNTQYLKSDEMVWPHEAISIFNSIGFCHYVLKEPALAITALENSLKINFKQPNIIIYLGKLIFDTKQKNYFHSALLCFNKALKIDRNLFKAYLARSCCYAHVKNYGKAIMNCNKAISISPKSIRAHMYRGCLKTKINALEYALDDLNVCVSLNSESALLYFNRGVLYHKAEKYIRGLSDYSIAIILSSEKSLIYFKSLLNRAIIYYKLLQYRNVVADCLNAIKSPLTKKFRSEVVNIIARSYFRLKQYDKCLSCLNIELKNNPRNIKLLIARGNVYTNLKGSIHLARDDYNKVLKINPKCFEAMINIALAYKIEGKIEKSIEHCNDIIHTFPDSAEAYHIRGILYDYRFQRETALSDMTKALELSKNAYILNNFGIFSLLNKHISYKYFLRATASNLKDTEVKNISLIGYYNATNLLVHNHRFQEAIEKYTYIIKNDEHFYPAYINRACCLMISLNWTEACTNLNHIISCTKKYYEAFALRAIIHIHGENYSTGLKDIDYACKLEPDNYKLYKIKGDILFKMNKTELAHKIYAKILILSSKKCK